MSILVGICTRRLFLIVDVTKDTARGCSVRWGLIPLQCRRGKYVVVERSDGISSTKSLAESIDVIIVAIGEGVIGGVAVHVSGIEGHRE